MYKGNGHVRTLHAVSNGCCEGVLKWLCALRLMTEEKILVAACYLVTLLSRIFLPHCLTLTKHSAVLHFLLRNTDMLSLNQWQLLHLEVRRLQPVFQPQAQLIQSLPPAETYDSYHVGRLWKRKSSMSLKHTAVIFLMRTLSVLHRQLKLGR